MVYDILQGCKKTIMPSLLYTSYCVNTETLQNILNYACKPFSFFFSSSCNKCCSFNQVRKKKKKKSSEIKNEKWMFLAPWLYHIICAVFFVFRSVRSLYGWTQVMKDIALLKWTIQTSVCVVYAVSKCIFSGVHGWAGGGVYTCSDSGVFLLSFSSLTHAVVWLFVDIKDTTVKTQLYVVCRTPSEVFNCVSSSLHPFTW